MSSKACKTCGQPHPGCTAHKKSTGEPCRKRPIRGATVCASHGGAAPAVRAAARARLEHAEAARQVTTLGLPVDITPTDALLQEVQWTAGHVQWLRGKVAELDEQDLVWGTTRVKEGGDDRGTTEESKPSVWYVLYEAERKHLVAVCTAALKAGVEERKVVLAEKQGLLVEQVLRGVLDGMLAAMITAGMAVTLRDAWTAAMSEIVPRELRRIAGGAA